LTVASWISANKSFTHQYQMISILTAKKKWMQISREGLH
jgi:hypothetical protein